MGTTAELCHGHNATLTDMAEQDQYMQRERRLGEMRLSIVTAAASALKQIVVTWAAKMKKKLKN